jgi:nucleotide-binding universal stress UspA family protein
MVIGRILVPLDGSEAAEAVLPYIERIAAATNASVLLFAAVDRPRDWGTYTAGDLKESDTKRSHISARSGRLTSATDNDVEAEVVTSPPAEAILAAADKTHPDLIAMTTHGRSGVSRWVLGSIATKVLHATHTPMLVVRPPSEGKQGESPDLTKVLVPHDGSELSASALPFAVDLAKPLGASIVLFHSVVEPVLAYPAAETMAPDPRAFEELKSSARDFLNSAANDLADKGVKADTVVSVGNATDGIVWAATGRTPVSSS